MARSSVCDPGVDGAAHLLGFMWNICEVCVNGDWKFHGAGSEV